MDFDQALDSFDQQDVDVLLYSGGIEKHGYDRLCDILVRKAASDTRRSKVLLYLVTPGGNPNAGYRIARALIHHYGADNFRVAVPQECKSAGTLVCIGASSLVMFDRGELGPLDIQFQKQDELFEMSSGLDILRGMTYLQSEALATFNQYLIDINSSSGLSTKIASEIASKLVIGLYEPIFGQIDPARLGEMNAALQIAHQYGNRLQEKAKNLKKDALAKLINTYPTHGFVIDRAEARELFERVERPAPHELTMAAMMQIWTSPSRSALNVVDLIDFWRSIIPKENKDGNDTGTRGEGGAREDGGASGAQDDAGER